MSDSESHFDHRIAAVAEQLRLADSVLFITGAGLSAESGLPVYRGVGGLYGADGTEEGMPIEELLSGPMFDSDPATVWRYLAQIAHACQGATFNSGHEIIARFEQEIPRCWTLTQNVDGFHRAAGAGNVIEIHGNMHQLYCPRCSWSDDVDDPAELELPPECPDCGRIIRPDVVLFGEMLPFDKVERLHDELGRGFDVILVIGTSALFPYISEPVAMAVDSETLTVEINPDNTELTELVDIALPLPAGEALQQIWEAFLNPPEE